MSGDEKFRQGSDDSAHYASTPHFVSFVNDRLRGDPNYRCPHYGRFEPIGETLAEVNHTCMNFRRALILELAEECRASTDSKGTCLLQYSRSHFCCVFWFSSPHNAMSYRYPYV